MVFHYFYIYVLFRLQLRNVAEISSIDDLKFLPPSLILLTKNKENMFEMVNPILSKLEQITNTVTFKFSFFTLEEFIIKKM